MNSAGLREGLGRWGVVVLVLATVGLVLVVWRPGRFVDGPMGVLLILGIATYMVLFAERVPNTLPHPYFLYFDRYLFSEVLPLALIFVAIGLHAAIDAVGRGARARDCSAGRGGYRARSARHRARSRGVEHLADHAAHAVRRRVRRAGSRVEARRARTRTRRSCTRVSNPFPRTGSTATLIARFALPLRETFNRNMIGVFASHGDDPRRDPAQARAELARAGYTSGYLVAIRAPPCRALRQRRAHALRRYGQLHGSCAHAALEPLRRTLPPDPHRLRRVRDLLTGC